MVGAGGESTANLDQYLGGIHFPADKQALVKHAKGQQADKAVIDFLELLPDGLYTSMADVIKGGGRVM